MGSLGEVDHGKEKFNGHGHSDPIVDELNRLENLLRGLFFFLCMHACARRQIDSCTRHLSYATLCFHNSTVMVHCAT